MTNNEEKYNSYIVPDNYTTSGNVFGKVSIRNFIDAALFGGTAIFLNWKLVSGSFGVRIAVFALTVIPIVLVCLTGLDGGSLTEYVIRALSFVVDRRNLLDEECVEDYQNGKYAVDDEKSDDGESEKSQKKKKQFKYSLNTTTAESIPIEKIEEGIVKTTDGEYIKIVEVQPVNFSLLSATNQNSIIEGFAQWLKIAPVSIQFKCLSQQANSEKMIKRMESFKKNEPSDKCKRFIGEYMDLIQDIGTRQGVSRRFFIIFKYEGIDTAYNRNLSELEIYNELENVAISCESTLRRCGNSVIHHKNESEAVEKVFYELFNRNTATVASYDFKKEYAYKYYQKQLAKEQQERLAKGMDVNAPSEYIAPGLRDNLAPYQMDFSQPRYCKVDGLYYKFIYIDSNGYSSPVYAAWLTAIVNAGNGIDIDIFAHKEDAEKIKDSIQHKSVINRSQFKFSKDTNASKSKVGDAVQSSDYLLNAMNQYNEEFYWMNAIITITGYSEKEVEYRTNQIKNYLKSKDISIREAKYWEEKAFFSVLPLCHCDSELFKKSRRNILTHGLASSYIFTSLEVSDSEGVMFGINQFNNTLCFVDNFDLHKYTTPNMFIIGTSGSGKTYSTQQIAMRYRYQNIQTFILAPLKGREYRRPALALGGEFISISTASNNCINIMEIRNYDSNSADKELESEFGELNNSKLALKAQQLGTFFSLIVPDIKNEERQAVDDEIMKTYESFGITIDNKSLYDENGQVKKMPILGDLYERLKKNEMTKRVATIMNRFVNGSAKVFNQQTNVDLTNKYIVFDISDLGKELLPIGMFVVLDFVWDTIKADRTKKKILFLDEVWTLIGASSNEYAAEFVLEIFKIIRGYGGVAIAATQDLNDFFALKNGAYGKGIVNQCNNKIILKLKEEEAKRVKDILDLNQSEIDEIVSFERGEAFFIADRTHLTIKFKATNLEHQYITSDREELARIARERAERREKSFIDDENANEKKLKKSLVNPAKNKPAVSTKVAEKTTDDTAELEVKNGLSLAQKGVQDSDEKEISVLNDTDNTPKNIGNVAAQNKQKSNSINGYSSDKLEKVTSNSDTIQTHKVRLNNSNNNQKQNKKSQNNKKKKAVKNTVNDSELLKSLTDSLNL